MKKKPQTLTFTISDEAKEKLAQIKKNTPYVNISAFLNHLITSYKIGGNNEKT